MNESQEEALSCTAHPEAADDDCPACNAILDALARDLEQISDGCATGSVPPLKLQWPELAWSPGHEPKR
jgi:hypothetical protein